MGPKYCRSCGEAKRCKKRSLEALQCLEGARRRLLIVLMMRLQDLVWGSWGMVVIGFLLSFARCSDAKDADLADDSMRRANSTGDGAVEEYEDWTYIHYIGIVVAAWLIFGFTAGITYALCFDKAADEEDEGETEKKEDGEESAQGKSERMREHDEGDEEHQEWSIEDGDANSNGHPLPEGWELWPPPSMTVQVETNGNAGDALS